MISNRLTFLIPQEVKLPTFAVSAFTGTQATVNQEALNLAAAKYVHRRSGVLRDVPPYSLNPLFEVYLDIFGILTADESFLPQGGLAGKYKHIVKDSARAFQVPELALHLFSKRRTHDTDSIAFVHARSASNNAADARESATTISAFVEEMHHKNVHLNRIRFRSNPQDFSEFRTRFS